MGIELKLSASDQLRHVGTMLGERDLPVLVARPSRMSDFAVSRLQPDVRQPGILVGSPRADGFGLTMFLSELPAFELSVDGKVMRAPLARAGQFQVHNLNVEITAHFKSPLDVIYFYIPRSGLNSVAQESNLSPIEMLDVKPGVSTLDTTVRDLCVSLLPSLQRIESASRLFMDHVGIALLTHLAQTYGPVARTRRDIDADLTASQARRAEEMIIARLDGAISLEELERDGSNLNRLRIPKSEGF